MKVEIPQIYWHGDRDRIMSIDFYPNTNLLITCGAESENTMFIKLWEIVTINPNSQIPPSNSSQNEHPQNNSSNNSDTQIIPKFIHELSGAHTATVNVVRFSPNGMYLATGGDDRAIVIWVQKPRFVSIGSTEEIISWGTYKILRGHLSDVYDLYWSPDSKYLISGSVDNCAICWNVEKSKEIHKIMDHTHFVQGVSWDPRNKYVTSESSDRSVKIYKIIHLKNNDIKFCYMNQLKKFELEGDIAKTKEKNKKNKSSANNDINKKTNNKMIIDDDDTSIKKDNNDIKMANVNNNNPNLNDEQMELEDENFNKNAQTNNNKMINNKPTKPETSSYYYFVDETQCPTFVRRHSWSPDGSICLFVSGIMKSETYADEIDYVVWGVTRKNISFPSFYIPTLDKCSVCVRFCPIIFKKEPKKDEQTKELLDLPYSMVFAIGTIDSVFIYSTDSIKPKYAVTNIHYLAITDLAWKGADMLAICSGDGYITFCQFEKGELGTPLRPDEIEDEKLKESYELYLNIDIKKNVMSNNYVPINIKPKKKKENNKEEQQPNKDNKQTKENIQDKNNTNSNNKMEIEKEENVSSQSNINNNNNMSDMNNKINNLNVGNNYSNLSKVSTGSKKKIVPILIKGPDNP